MPTISANIIGDGSVTPSLPVTVSEGGDLLVSFTPSAGWEISSILVDGIDIGTPSEHLFSSVYSDFNIDIVFAEIAGTTYTIDVEDNIYGIISPGGNVIVPEGDDQVFSIEVSSGFTHTFWVVDDVEIPATATYTFTNVTSNHTLGAKFEKDIVFSPTIKLLKMEELTIKRRDFTRGRYNNGFRDQGPEYQTFKILGNVQPGQTQSGLLQAVGEQVIQNPDYDYINKSWKVFTADKLVIKDYIVLEDGDYEVLDVDDWARFNLRSINYRSMVRQIKPRG